MKARRFWPTIRNHPDAANRWDRFGPPAIAEVEIDGPGRVTIGEEAVFDVYIDAFGEPYAVDDISSVQYLLFDAEGKLVEQGGRKRTAMASGS